VRPPTSAAFSATGCVIPRLSSAAPASGRLQSGGQVHTGRALAGAGRAWSEFELAEAEVNASTRSSPLPSKRSNCRFPRDWRAREARRSRASEAESGAAARRCCPRLRTGSICNPGRERGRIQAQRQRFLGPGAAALRELRRQFQGLLFRRGGLQLDASTTQNPRRSGAVPPRRCRAPAGRARLARRCLAKVGQGRDVQRALRGDGVQSHSPLSLYSPGASCALAKSSLMVCDFASPTTCTGALAGRKRRSGSMAWRRRWTPRPSLCVALTATRRAPLGQVQRSLETHRGRGRVWRRARPRDRRASSVTDALRVWRTAPGCAAGGFRERRPEIVLGR